jgi:hypothetical protein
LLLLFLLLSECLLEELEGLLVLSAGIIREFRPNLEAEVPLVPRETLLMLERIVLQDAIPVREALRRHVAL